MSSYVQRGPAVVPAADAALVCAAALRLLRAKVRPGRSLKTTVIPFSQAKPRADSASSARPSAVLQAALESAWAEFEKRVREARKHFSEEAVHELRVSARRLMARLELCVGPEMEEAVTKSRRSLKRHLKAFSALRDTHVQRVHLQERLDPFPELLLLSNWLAARERQLEKKLAPHTRNLRVGRLRKTVAAVVARLGTEAGDPESERCLSLRVLGRCGAAWEEVLRRHALVDAAMPATIHSERIAFKKFRYMAEALSPALTGLGKRELAALARYQRRLGIIQDLEVLEGTVATFVASHPGSRSLMGRYQRELARRARRALRAYLAARNEIHAFWPART